MSSFKKEFLSGVFYTSIAKYIGLFVSLLITFILARLLTPEDFGVIAIAYMIINFINLLTDFGFGPAIVQIELDDRDIGSLFSLTTIVGAIAGLIVFFVATPISIYYANDALVGIVRILALNVLFASLNTVPYALLLKAKRFKSIAIRTLITQIGAGIIAVTLAYFGYGVYSLAVQSIIGVILGFAFNYYCAPIKVGIPVYKNTVRKVFSFSIYQFLASVFQFFTKDIDKPIVGRFFNMQLLGYYEKSYRLMQLPVGNLSSVFAPVMQPVFRDFRDNMIEMKNKYGKLLEYMSIVSFPLSVFLFFEASDLILLCYGKQWINAIEPFRMLSFSVGFQILLMTTGPLCQSCGKVKVMFINNLVEFVIVIASLLVGIYFESIRTVAIAISIGILVRFIYVFAVVQYIVLNTSIFSYIKHFAHGFIVSFLCAVPMFITNTLWICDKSLFRLIISTLIFVMIILISMSHYKLISVKTIYNNKQR